MAAFPAQSACVLACVISADISCSANFLPWGEGVLFPAVLVPLHFLLGCHFHQKQLPSANREEFMVNG